MVMPPDIGGYLLHRRITPRRQGSRIYQSALTWAFPRLFDAKSSALHRGRCLQGLRAIQSAFRQLGSALGIAVLFTVFFTALDANLQVRLTDAGLPAAQAEQLSRTVTDSAGAVIAPLASDPHTVAVAESVREAMTTGLAFGAYLGAGFLLLALLATALIPAAARNAGRLEEAHHG